MAYINFHDIKSDIALVRSNSQSKLNRILEPLQDRNVLLAEMRNLLTANVTFSTPQFIQAAEQITQADKDWEEMKRKPFNAYYVYVRMVGSEQWVDIVDATDAQKYSNVEHCPVTSVPVSDVPEDIQGKVAVLSMGQIGQYMQGVGVRTTEKSFWLER